MNNNYSDAIIDKYIKKFLDQKQSQVPEKSDKEIIPIYYENQYHANYKKEERVIKDLVYSNIKSTDEKTKLDLRIYYKNPRTCNLVMKNNISPPTRVLDETNARLFINFLAQCHTDRQQNMLATPRPHYPRDWFHIARMAVYIWSF